MIRTSMKRNVFSIHENEIIANAAKLFVNHRIGTLPVVDGSNKLIGILTLQCVLKIVMPDFVNVVQSFAFLKDFGAMEARVPLQKELERPIKEIMMEPFSVNENWSLLHAAAILNKENVIDIPVVDDNGILVGLASHVDIGTALIKSWDLK